MTIGVDCDGIFFNYVGQVASMCNAMSGRKVASVESARSTDVWKCWGTEHLKHMVDDLLISTKSVRYMPVYSGAVSFMKRLKEITGDDFIMITACPPSWHEQREEALACLGVNRKQISYSYTKNKFNVDALIDDIPENFEGYKGFRILLDQPWNRETTIAHHRSFSYDDVLENVKRIVKWNNR